MYNPTLRLLGILELLQSRGEVSGQELAQTLEVDERSIRRYIMMLRDIGIPIEGERGRGGGYAIRPGFRLPPLMFNAEEITAVTMGLMLLRQLGATSPLAIESATAKIERVLPDEVWTLADALGRTLTLHDAQPGARGISGEWLMTITRAAHEGRCLDITYESAEGETTARMIAPYGLVLHGRAWYIPAYCYLRDDKRVFRLDRIRTLANADTTFTPPTDFDATAFILDSLASMFAGQAFEVVLHIPLATAQEVIMPSMFMLSAEGHDTLMRGYTDDMHWLTRYLAKLELSFTIRETPELVEALQMLAENLLATVQRSAQP